ncbi:hypothetical protein [Actinophytocola gossypii]|uniref:Uncharacterized protein n=1 Tax=Actinophytocola gossypii TaxID=2812003 RepID=A0ABT2J168_9PSEU|nr:hypothetical protein [Actinophytocola gossypii]MCT2581553.1 hypothetical protein [Actinophytocola gossypii]
MSRGPEIDRETAEAEQEDDDFAGEHTRPTYSDEPPPDPPDESVPEDRGGAGGMDTDRD